jgi:hypothetical protein
VPPASLLGDADCDGLVAPSDLDQLSRELVDGDGDQASDVDGGAVVSCAGADTNGDGVLSVADLTAQLRILHGETDAMGPVITFLGIASADGTTTTPVSDVPVPLFQTVGGIGFRLVIEAMPGRSGLPVGQNVFNYDPFDATARPDLQVEVGRDLGDGNRAVCGEGGVAGVAPAQFGPEQPISDALNDLACRFDVATNPSVGCTNDEFGAHRFVDPRSRVQFCLSVSSVESFPSALTNITARLLDTVGNPGPIAQMVLRVGGEPLFTPTPRPTATPQATATTTDTVTPGPSPTATDTAIALPTTTDTVTPSSPTRVATRTATPTGPTPTRTRTATITRVPTRTNTSARTLTATRTPIVSPTPTATRPRTGTRTTTGTPTRSATRTMSAPATATRTPRPSGAATSTVTRTRTRSGTPTATKSASAAPTRTVTRTGSPGNTPTLTRTGTRTRTGTATRTPSVTRTPTRTATITRTPTITLTPTITRTRTQTGTPTRTPRPGPDITFVGVARADDRLIEPVGQTPEGFPLYKRSFGSLFTIVVEAKPGPNRRPVGLSTFNSDLFNPGVRPDFEIIVSRPLGDGSALVCDNMLPVIGGVPASPNFNETQPITDAINDFGCRFVNGAGVPRGRGPGEACTLFADGEYHFKFDQPSGSTAQFCASIAEPFGFPNGRTTVTVRARDSNGSPGPQASFVIEVGP